MLIPKVGSKRPWPAAEGLQETGRWCGDGDVRPHPIVAMGPDRHHRAGVLVPSLSEAFRP
jgi:hypothetical protein